MTPVRLEPTAPRYRVKHTTTEPLHSLFPGIGVCGGGGGEEGTGYLFFITDHL